MSAHALPDVFARLGSGIESGRILIFESFGQDFICFTEDVIVFSCLGTDGSREWGDL